MTDRLTEARNLLKKLGLPKAQQNEVAAYTLLALVRVGPDAPWSEATATSQGLRKGVMDYVRETYGKTYAENTRETFRRGALHQFQQAGLVVRNPDEPNLPTNSPRTHYQVTPEALIAIQTYDSDGFDAAAQSFRDTAGSLAERYAMVREQAKVPVVLPDGKTIILSPGKHNEVERAVVEEFGARFAPGSRLLYLGDTSEKAVLVDRDGLTALGFKYDAHDKMPDVVLYDEAREWLLLVEAVTSHGPMEPKRVAELKDLFAGVTAGLVFISAFPNRAEYRKHQADIAWETEVWLADEPSHMLHYNGDRFMGPHGD
ncbi:MAG: BsuBI/PstI family type II restriction endonuclease [Actinomycetota bacterium]|nr:BsuBI/PstI family type II restriction endonuclease [Actinomycetota bacterium]